MPSHKLTVAFLDTTIQYRRYFEPLLRSAFDADITVHSTPNRAADIVFFSSHSDVPKTAGKKVMLCTQSAPILIKSADLIIDCKRLVVRNAYLPLYVLSFAERFRHRPEDLLVAKSSREIASKAKFCAYLYTQPNEVRQSLFQAVTSYKHVDALGKHLHNQSQAALPNTAFVQKRQGFSKPGAKQIVAAHAPPVAMASIPDRDLYMPGVRTYLDSAVDKYRPYKFVLVCENTVAPGYVTENLVSAMLAHAVPIYYGAPDVTAAFNPKSFINASSFPNFTALAHHIRKVDTDAHLYESIFLEPWFKEEQTLPKIFQPDYLASTLKPLLPALA
jgi:hypothetical protein